MNPRRINHESDRDVDVKEFQTGYVHRNEGESVCFTVRGIDSQDPIDFQTLDNLRILQRQGQPDILKRVIKAYLDSSPKLLTALCEALASENMGNIQRTAHSLKSGSAHVGALTLAALYRQMEEMGRNGAVGNASQLLHQIENEAERVRTTLINSFIR